MKKCFKGDRDVHDMQPDDDATEKVLILPLGEESKKVTKVLSNDSARQMLELLVDKPMSASDVSEKLEVPLTTVKYNLDALIEAGLIKVKETKWSVKGRKVKIYAPIRKLIVVVPDKTDRDSVTDILQKYLVVLFGAAGLSAIIEWWCQPTFRGTQDALVDVVVETGGSSVPVPVPTPSPAPLMKEGTQFASEGVASSANVTNVASAVPGAVETDAMAAVTPTPVNLLPVTESTPMTLPIPGADMGASSIDFSQVLGAHPGAWFLLGCVSVVVILVLLEYRKGGGSRRR
ncbi:MAG: winged helix-turn-helix domain-containing protein [Euryarchaeota archaeon]|nr:winged helix-turn-helix domain-containing protein [Euryarchaeota archaeon]